MRQHVNPLSKNFDEVKIIPSLSQMFDNTKLNLHLDIGCAAGQFLFDLALANHNWNYLGIEIRERLVMVAKSKVQESEIKNLYFIFSNANNFVNDFQSKFILSNLKSISFNFPDPWFKKRHYKRRVIQPEFINNLSNSMQKGSLIFIKTDVKDLFDYMDRTILSNLNFKKIDKKDFNYSESFNPNRFQTSREKYVIDNELDVFERIYIKFDL
ncbi:tRNA (guanosine(46)-N7)-methyltransferase TrmB [Prochlorococcus marinus str. MU1404]|uniref:tRNA (guanosine(46)-N7)-methyltransferase TrmB n=1 Tax=Prochlorococcus marinus TaxID=1219 RepID=UPI001ADC4D8A|nr:tRNA (guanosine(46)-N7)-methyltransferase TrmB [Prochlorococcus marinus]MBO8229412.1 tRNA (guanosine(46)-N7)-methyltransferase TrmB [Prochlorococcus marinus XMU1404]MBW3072495.1 tRNA (guanosine(46)-N7)-methyltransferase TrmB [Prochlorococcus marinus str. MU1404]MCR8544404.1 tRNA (guanosine(46)-N7)-methyltransferase TrmB [Prochlorococcus marinus CUG1432]